MISTDKEEHCSTAFFPTGLVTTVKWVNWQIVGQNRAKQFDWHLLPI
jgi:hypothetical protein